MPTSEQMLRRMEGPKLTCCDDEDFSATSHLSAFSCVMQKTCPICGSRGQTITYGKQATFFCDLHTDHRYEFDKDTGTADRIG